jgi:hypothetical protein
VSALQKCKGFTCLAWEPQSEELALGALIMYLCQSDPSDWCAAESAAKPSGKVKYGCDTQACPYPCDRNWKLLEGK